MPEATIGSRSLSGRFWLVTADRKRPNSSGKHWLKSDRLKLKQSNFKALWGVAVSQGARHTGVSMATIDQSEPAHMVCIAEMSAL